MSALESAAEQEEAEQRLLDRKQLRPTAVSDRTSDADGDRGATPGLRVDPETSREGSCEVSFP